MRLAHDGKPPGALAGAAARCYPTAMQTTRSLTRALRWSAAGLLLTGLGTWLATGAHCGWTQTSIVTMQKDEVTGIDYPVRRRAFVAGVEVPLAAAAGAAALTALSFATHRRRSPVTA